MSILVDFGITTDHFELGAFIAEREGLTGELERIVPTDDRVIPFVWVTGREEDLEELTDSLVASEKTDDVSVLDRLSIANTGSKQYLYRIEWILEDLDIIRGIVLADGAILRGESVDDHWRLQFRFSRHEDVATFYQYLADNGITDFQIWSIQELRGRTNHETSPLTVQQREALTLAAERGYFDLPRRTSLEAIGEELGITQQATSERVRRAVRNVVLESLNLVSVAG